MTLAQLVRSARTASGLSRPRLAAVSGVPLDTIDAVERGVTRNPGVRTVARLVAALHIDPAAAFRASLEDAS